MAYRYWVHPFAHPDAPLQRGRRLRARTEVDAIAEAARLLEIGAYPNALGVVVMDTDVGKVIWRREH